METTMTDRIETPENLAANPDSIPAWARGAEARLIGESGSVDAWDLYRGDTLVGCMYDDGSGYIYVEGQSIEDGDWSDTDMPWA